MLVLDRSGSIRAAQTQVIAFAHEIVSEFKIGAHDAQIGVVEFSSKASVLIGLSGSKSQVDAAIDAVSGSRPAV